LTIIPWIIPIRLVDLLEIGLFAFILYKLYQMMRGTIAIQIFLGVLALYMVQVIVTALDMTMMTALFGSLSEVIVLAVIVLFQPEIRRLLLVIGQNPLVRRFVSTTAQDEMIKEVVSAVESMSRQRIGALLAFERSTGLRSYVETGTPLNARVTQELLITIFYSQNPLHDGAVIIRNRRIEAARAILPVSTSTRLSPQLGLRHRSGVGLSEQTDAFIVIVSEETGTVSVAQEGDLITNLTPDELQAMLSEALNLQPDERPMEFSTGDS
jgi:diadenylate cyclase